MTAFQRGFSSKGKVFFITFLLLSSLFALFFVRERFYASKSSEQIRTKSSRDAEHLSKTYFPASDLQVLRDNSFKMTDDESSPLFNRETVIVTVASHHVIDFIHNLHCFTTQSSGQKLVLFALDKNVSDSARRNGIQTVLWKDFNRYKEDIREYNETDSSIIFGTEDFRKLSMLKFEVV